MNVRVRRLRNYSTNRHQFRVTDGLWMQHGLQQLVAQPAGRHAPCLLSPASWLRLPLRLCAPATLAEAAVSLQSLTASSAPAACLTGEKHGR